LTRHLAQGCAPSLRQGEGRCLCLLPTRLDLLPRYATAHSAARPARGSLSYRIPFIGRQVRDDRLLALDPYPGPSAEVSYHLQSGGPKWCGALVESPGGLGARR
jgi:hypothetical protein